MKPAMADKALAADMIARRGRIASAEARARAENETDGGSRQTRPTRGTDDGVNSGSSDRSNEIMTE